jgi:ankyrin repeat protein
MMTPLMRACALGRVDIAKVLLEAGASVHLRDSQGLNCSDHAMKRKGNGDIFKLLQEVDSSIVVPDNDDSL